MKNAVTTIEIFDVGWLPGRRRVELWDATRATAQAALTAPGFAYWVKRA